MSLGMKGDIESILGCVVEKEEVRRAGRAFRRVGWRVVVLSN